MRLRTLESFWLLKNGLLHTYPMLQDDMNTDIIVVGGGITGALISDAILDLGYKVVVVDKRDIGQGSTSATTSMLQYEIDEMLIDLSTMIGETAAANCYQAGIDAISDLEKLIERKKIDCGFKRCTSLYIAHNKKSAAKLKKEFSLRDKYKLGVQWWEKEEIQKQYGIISEGGILSKTAASIDAYALAHALIHLNTKRGLIVHDQTELLKPIPKRNGVHIKTKDGRLIKAKKIIYCTGFETLTMFKEKIAELSYTYATVSEPFIDITPNLIKLLVWNTANPYLYMRSTDDGRYLVGGEDEPYSEKSNPQSKKEKKSKTLQSKLSKTIPALTFIEDFSWGGVFGSTKDGLPYIGISPEYKNCLFCLGFGGNGITFSIQGRKIITDLLQNNENELSHLYRFGR